MVLETKHFGCYAMVIRRRQLLCVLKTRGPYEGLWDLPGGAPEPRELPDQTLRRELLEETGGTEIGVGPWHAFALAVDQDSKGRPIQFCHEGLWRRCDLDGVTEGLAPREDVGGLAWIDLEALDLESLSPLVRHVLGLGFGGD